MEELIIASVYKRDPLWNPSHGLYKNVLVLKKLWQEVANELKTDEKHVKTKWKNMRAYFFKELKKMQIAKSGDGSDTMTSHWAFFEQLQFLKGTISASDSESNFSIVDPLVSADTSLKDEPLTPRTEDSTDIQEDNSSSDGESIASPAKKKKYYNTNNFVEQNHQILELEKRDIAISERGNNSKTNSDMLFFESLLPYMADIPKIQKLRLRSKIQDLILTELEIASNDNQQQ